LRLSKDQFSIDAALRKGRKLPDWYLDEPPLGDGDHFYLKAFWDLNTCRPSGWGAGPIPWDKIIRYAEWACLDGILTNVFVLIIQRMDTAYLTWVEKNKPEQGKMRDSGKTSRQQK